MRNLKLEIEYDGTNYAGWQVQNSRQSSVVSRQLKTIQETIEKTLQKILQEKIKLIASGRTDTGVHALGQVANFKTNSAISTEKLQRALNGLLSDDISITKIEEAALNFHSRFSAKSKIYRYIILNQKARSALLRDRVYFYPFPLDIKLMRKTARSLTGRHDFKAFCSSHSSAKNTVRTIKSIVIKKSCYGLWATDYGLITIDIQADGFLYNMVRRIVGRLIEVGRGKFSSHSCPTAPSSGLYLLKVA